MGRYQKLGMNSEANRTCMGLLLGLYRFERESTIEFKDWATDMPVASAERVVYLWKQGAPSQADVKVVKAFVEDELCGWGTIAGLGPQLF